jgi:hypothetical protein
MTRWASDDMTYGSYSSVAVGSAGPADYAAMARPVGDRLFFAGEATSTRCVAQSSQELGSGEGHSERRCSDRLEPEGSSCRLQDKTNIKQAPQAPGRRSSY